LGLESIKRFRSAIGSRLSYCFRSSSDTFRARASFPKISSEGNRLPSSISERKGEEMPIFFANSRKDKSALSRNSRSRWPKEISIMCRRKKLAGSLARPMECSKSPLRLKLDFFGADPLAHWLHGIGRTTGTGPGRSGKRLARNVVNTKKSKQGGGKVGVQRQENEQSEAERRRRLEKATQNGESSRLFATNSEAFPKISIRGPPDDIPEKIARFVSSTYEDLKERQAAVEVILTAGHIPAGIELLPRVARKHSSARRPVWNDRRG
jgi:hypothetical protein